MHWQKLKQFLTDQSAQGEGDDEQSQAESGHLPETTDERGKIPEVLPILPVRDLVCFPGTVVPITVGRPASIQLLEENLPASRVVGIVTQRGAGTDQPASSDLYGVGTAALVLKFIRQSEEKVLLILNGLDRIAIRQIAQEKPYIRAHIEVLKSSQPPSPKDKEWQATLRNLRETASELIGLTPETPDEMRVVMMNIDDPGHLVDFLASGLSLDLAHKQRMLEQTDVVERARILQERIAAQLEIAHIQRRLHQDVTSQFTDMQRRAYLHEQLKAIQRELGESETGVQEQVAQLRERLKKANPPKAVIEQAERELGRLNFVPPASAEYPVIVSYVETVADLPWSRLSEDNLDLNQAEQVLDRDHFDLEKVKRRLIEYLAVRKLNPNGRGPILCFVGPPGVGKTSLGQSIADALDRRFSRTSLGGMRDEAEIRGHRRTYIGSMPGRIIQELRRVGTRNPVMMLDEIDKLGTDFRGDPSSALLEVLDPKQNHAFVDHYLDVPFDLSQVLFIATANYMEPVPPALRDRLEVIELPGYTDREKLEIARHYLVDRQLRENGLTTQQCDWQQPALVRVIDDYTREAGVRELERQIGSVCRAVAAKIAKAETEHVTVSPEWVEQALGPAKYIREKRMQANRPGVVTALAYTPMGGEVLYIEAIRYAGKGNILLTGHIGEVMKESVQAALSLVKSRVEELGIDPEIFRDTDIHVHVPSGAVPKDGPSAGVAMFTALASLFTNRSVSATLAMTGEISLRGLVLPIGGLKEKTLAAMRMGITNVVIPKLNEKDLADLPTEVKQSIHFTFVETVDELLAAAFEPTSEAASVKASPQAAAADASGE